MTGGGATSGFWGYRHEQETLGRANGTQPFTTKACNAAVSGIVAGLGYGAFYWAYYPDKLAFAHKNTITSGPTRGWQYLQYTTIRPMVLFTTVGVTFSAVESFLEEMKDSHQKDPWNTAIAGAASGFVMGSFVARRFDVASMAGLGIGVLMGLVELNGSNIICDPVADKAKKYPKEIPATYVESEALSNLKELYPKFKDN